MGSYLFTNVRILDGSGAPAYPGEVLVQGKDPKTSLDTVANKYKTEVVTAYSAS